MGSLLELVLIQVQFTKICSLEMGGVNANSIVQSAMREIEVLEDLNFLILKFL